MIDEVELPDIDTIEAQAGLLDSSPYATSTREQEQDRKQGQQQGARRTGSEDEPMLRYRGLQRYVQMLVDVWFKTPQRVAATVCLVLVCISIIWWNLSRLSILDELVALETTHYELDAQLNDLQIELATLDLNSLAAAIEAENDRVFQGFPELAAWSEGLARVASLRGIRFSYKVKPAHVSPIPEILEVPLVLSFRAEEGRAATLFVECMDLINSILKDHWHVDVVSTTAQGDGEELREIELQAQVWVKDRFGFVDAASLIQAQSSENDRQFADLD